MRRVIVLRPEPGASETVARARELGLDALSIPLFEIEPVPWTAPEDEGFDGLLLTSANAVRQAGDGLGPLRGLPAYAVGEATAAAAGAAGLTIGATGKCGVDSLLGSIDPNLRLLHLCGEDRIIAVGDAPSIVAVPVYRARIREEADLTTVPGSIVLVHSPRAARRLGELVGQRASTAIAAVSRAAAAAAGGGWEQIEVADRPSDQALLALAARLCDKTAAE